MGLQRRLDEAIRAYYEQRVDEEVRLTSTVGGRVELERTRRLLDAVLPVGARVLDVGGGTGVHSRWLAGRGYAVTLVDPVPSHVARAAEAGTFSALVGDARDLPVADGSADAVLLLGPLYHLITRDDRDRALGEARRVLRPGGVLLAQGIGRLTAFTEAAIRRGFPTLDEADLAILRTGVWFSTHGNFPGGHFHTAEELRREAEAAGFVELAVHGLEGPDVGALELVADDDRLVDLAVALVERLEERLAGQPVALGWLAERSPHVLVIARRP